MDGSKVMQLGATTGLQSKKKYEQDQQNDHPSHMVSSINHVRMVRMSKIISIHIRGKL
jgi:hypothetical protein